MAAQRGIAIDNRVQDSDFEDCDALLEGRMGDGWQLFFQTPDVQIRRRVTEGSSLTEFRLDGVIPFPCALFFEMLTCLEYRRIYDKFTAEIRKLPNAFADTESDCIYWRLKLPLLAERDYVFLRRIVYEPSTLTYRLVSLSATYGAGIKAQPLRNGAVRVEQYVSKAVMRPRGPEACEYHLLASQDLKGNVPSMVIDFFASKGLATMVGGHAKACANFVAWKAAFRGEVHAPRVGRYRAADYDVAARAGAAADEEDADSGEDEQRMCAEEVAAGTAVGVLLAAAAASSGAEHGGEEAADEVRALPARRCLQDSTGGGAAASASSSEAIVFRGAGGDLVPPGAPPVGHAASAPLPSSTARAGGSSALAAGGSIGGLGSTFGGNGRFSSAVGRLRAKVGDSLRLSDESSAFRAAVSAALRGDVARGGDARGSSAQQQHGGGGGGASFGSGASRQSAQRAEQLLAKLTQLKSGVASGVTRVDAQLAAALARAADGLGAVSAESASTLTQDYLELLADTPMRLVAALPPARGGSGDGGLGGGGCCAPGALSLSDASQPSRGAQRPASVCSSLDQLRIGALYRTPRGNLVKRTGLTSATLGGTIELPVRPRADSPPEVPGGFDHSTLPPTASCGTAGALGLAGGLGAARAVSAGDAPSTTGSVSSDPSELVPTSQPLSHSGGAPGAQPPQLQRAHTRTLQRARVALSATMRASRKPPVASAQPPATAGVVERCPIDAQIDALERKVLRAEQYHVKRMDVERSAATAFATAYTRMGAAEGKMLEIEDGLDKLSRVGQPAARALLERVETFGPQLLEQHGPMQERIAQSFGGGLQPTRAGPQLTVTERLALKLGI